MSNFYCQAIQKNIRLETDSTNNTLISPCCVYKNKQQFTSITDYYHSQDYQSLLAAQDWPLNCQVCKQTEEQGLTSYRNYFSLKERSNDGISFEIMPSNICNLRCIMCASDSSSALAKERFDIGLDKINISRETNQTVNQLDIVKQFPNIESLSVIGGEFFLTKGNLEVMDFARDRDLPFRVVTNATVILDSHLEKLQQLKHLDLQISIDGVDTGYEFIRYPGKWINFDRNTRSLIKNLPNAKINFHFVAQVINIFQLIPTLNYTNRFIKPTRVTGLVKPEYLGWQILNDQERTRTIDFVQKQISQYRITAAQKTEVDKICQAIKETKFNLELRFQFQNIARRFYQHRKLTEQDLQKNLGLLYCLLQ